MPTSSSKHDRARVPWSKGRLLGHKRPAYDQRTSGPFESDYSSNAAGVMFNLTIDSKLRRCDLVRLRTTDICLGG